MLLICERPASCKVSLRREKAAKLLNMMKNATEKRSDDILNLQTYL